MHSLISSWVSGIFVLSGRYRPMRTLKGRLRFRLAVDERVAFCAAFVCVIRPICWREPTICRGIRCSRDAGARAQ